MFKLRFDRYITPCTFTSPTKMTTFFGTVRSTNDNKMSKVHARSHEITISHYEFVLQKHFDYQLEKQKLACTSFVLYLKVFKNHLYYLWHARLLSIKPCLHTQLPEHNLYLLTEWEGRTGKYLARGPYVLTESQIFSRPARPYSVNKHFII